MSRGFFVTGTDTGVGKTLVACALVDALVRAGFTAVGMKPVASGCRRTALGLRSEDAERLIAAGNIVADYAEVNPYAFEPAVAPHIAAARAGIEIERGKILEHVSRLQARADYVVVEGVGGWTVPLGDTLTTADVAAALKLPVVLVVGLRLGCLNHALLTAQAIERAGLTLAGWVANQIDPHMALVEENIDALAQRLRAPRVAHIPYHAQGIGRIDALSVALDKLPKITGNSE